MFKVQRNRESKNWKAVKAKSGRLMLLSNCAVCNSKTLRFVKEHEAIELLSSLGIKGS